MNNIEINKDGAVYQLLDRGTFTKWGGEDTNFTDLCSFVKKLFFSLLRHIVLWSIITFAGFCVVFFLSFLNIDTSYAWGIMSGAKPATPYLVLLWFGGAFCMMLFALMCILLFVIVISELKEELSRYSNKHNQVRKNPSILVAYLKAKKEKFCPLVVVVDKTETKEDT